MLGLPAPYRTPGQVCLTISISYIVTIIVIIYILNVMDSLSIYIAIMLLFNAIDRKAEKLLPYSICIMAGRYKRVKIHQ